MPINSNCQPPRVYRFRPKCDLTVIAPNRGGDPLGSISGPMGSHWSKKCFKTVKHYYARKFEFSTTPRSSISAKMWPYGYGAKSRWDFLGFNLGPMGSHWVQKMGKNRKKLPCLKIRIFDYPTIIDFGQNAT